MKNAWRSRSERSMTTPDFLLRTSSTHRHHLCSKNWRWISRSLSQKSRGAGEKNGSSPKASLSLIEPKPVNELYREVEANTFDIKAFRCQISTSELFDNKTFRCQISTSKLFDNRIFRQRNLSRLNSSTANLAHIRTSRQQNFSTSKTTSKFPTTKNSTSKKTCPGKKTPSVMK